MKKEVKFHTFVAFPLFERQRITASSNYPVYLKKDNTFKEKLKSSIIKIKPDVILKTITQSLESLILYEVSLHSSLQWMGETLQFSKKTNLYLS